MPAYLYDCPHGHGRREVWKPMSLAGREESCPVCALAMRRVYTAPTVQNLTASRNTLRSWGRDLRVERGVTDGDGLVATRRAQQRALDREGAPPPRAATME